MSVLDRIGGDCTSFWGVVCLMEGDVVGVLYVGGQRFAAAGPRV